MHRLDAILLLTIGLRHYGWQLSPVAHQADIWNSLGSAAVLAGFCAAVYLPRGRFSGTLLSVLAAHELAVIIASVAYILAPWHVPEGQGQMSAWVHFDMAKLGGLLVMLALVKVLGSKTCKV